MNNFSRLLVLFALFGNMVGCATGLSQQECEVADWHAIGFEDGAKGSPEALISKHRKACAEHGITPQLNEYRQGWLAGVETYCRPANAYQLGRKGRSYGGVCPGNLETAFITAYSDGRSLYVLQKDVRHLSRSLTQKRNRLKTIDVEMRDAGLELVASGIPTERRVVLVDTLRKLGEERIDAKTEIPVIEARLEQKRQQLDTLSSAHAY